MSANASHCQSFLQPGRITFERSMRSALPMKNPRISKSFPRFQLGLEG